MERPPALGERAALAGYVPQYEVAAGLLLRALTEEILEWLALMDPEAERLDDFQLATPSRLDAFQIKWSQAGGQVPWSELLSYLVDVVSDRRKLADQYPDRRVVGHLCMDRVASNSPISTAPGDQAGATGANAVAQLLHPATEGAFSSVDELPTPWTWLWSDLAQRCDLSEQELLSDFRHVRFELGMSLPSRVHVPGREHVVYQRDLQELMMTLLRLATDPRQLVRITKDELLARLGPTWQQRMELRSVHEFPAPTAYQPVRETIQRLNEALDRFTTGYVALVGSPGSGKSTLLTQELRGRGDVVARYYAYVRGRTDLGSMRAEASAFLHDLVLTLERGGLPRGPAPVDFDVVALSVRLQRQLSQLGDRYQQEGKRSIVLVDGLDHVEREHDVEESLLRYLPRPEELPDGVLFVVGSQTDRMLHADIRAQLTLPGRTVEMMGLDRAAVVDLAQAWRVVAEPGRLWEVSGGHPLILTYLLQELRDLHADKQEARLALSPAYGGDVEQLYLRVWAAVEGDEDLVELLALACRMRGAVDLNWLREHGQSLTVVRRLGERLAHLFRREPERWYFFHESFRLFLQHRTARLGGVMDPDEHRRPHRRLAEMCRDTGAADPRSWEVLFHLSAAEEHEAVLATATPKFFRDQLLALRPPELVGADIRMAAGSLATVQDPMALVRLAIAAGELSQRSYNMPDREKFLSMLVRTGQWRTAVEHMEVERERFGEEDSRTARLRMALLLHDGGQREDARRVFEANEPVDVLAGGAESRQLNDPYQLLYAWARAAAVLRGPDVVLTAARELHLPREEQPYDNNEEDPTPGTRAWMLAAAADELDAREQRTEADSLLASLDPRRQEDQGAWVRALSRRWSRQSDLPAESLGLVIARLLPGDLDAEERIVVAEGLGRAGQQESARQWIDSLPQPPLSNAIGVRDLWDEEGLRYRLNRLLAAFGDDLDSEQLVPPPARDSDWGYVFIARITIAIAQLHGRAWAGEQLPVGEFVAAARSVLRIFEMAVGGDWTRRYQLKQVRPHALAQLLVVANLHGRGALQALWREYEQRWHEKPERLRHEGHQVLLAALDTGRIPRGDVLERLHQLEDLVRATFESGEAPRELTDLAETMLEAGLEEDAKRLVREAVAKSLAVYHRKDYQLSEWIGLLGPRLDGERGADLVRWLAGAAAELGEEGSDVPIGSAARRLLLADSARRPGHAWGVGAWLEERKIVECEDRLAIMLEAQVEHAANPLWWTVLIELLTPITPDPPLGLLGPAGQRAASEHGVAWLRQRLQALLGVVEVEAPPQGRETWRLSIADCAAAHAIALAEIRLPEELHPDLRPPRSRSRGTDEDQRDAFLAVHNSVATVLAGARDGDLSDWRVPWAEAVEIVVGQMNLGQVKEVAEIFSAGSDRLSIQLCLARRALELGAPDIASELAEGVLKEAEPRSWLRNWDRGPLMGAFRLLAELDRESTRDRAYRRFASDAASETFLLSEMSQELDHFVDLFGVDDRDALGQEVERYLRVLLDDPEVNLLADFTGAGDDAPTALARAGLELLASPYRLAVTTAQREILATLCDGDARVQALVADSLQGDDEELVLRVLSVLESALELEAELDDHIVDALGRWATADHLGLRLASRRLAERLGRTIDPTPARSLPASYSILVPERPEPEGMQTGRVLGSDDLVAVMAMAEGELRAMANLSGIDLGTLNARAAVLARRLAGGQPVDDDRWKTDSAPLGWTFYKPSVLVWERAVARVAGELVDARRIEPEEGLLLSTGPMYDPALIASRPSPRPDVVVAAHEGEGETWISVERWLEGLQGAVERLAQKLTHDWTILGEQTELRNLDRDLPRERRTQTLGALQLLDPWDRPGSRSHTRLAELDGIRAAVGASPLVRHWDPSFRGPSGWLAIHPRLAEACGWSRDPEVLIGWRDDEGPVVQSLGWRSGWLDSSRWIGSEEVGEGWLVLARARALERLAEILGGDLGVAWQVKRDFLVPDQPSREETGVRALA